IVRAPPHLHLLGAPFHPRIVLVEADEVAIVALVERLILEHRNARLPDLLEHEVERMLRANERRGEGDIEADILRIELAPGGARFLDTVVGEANVTPTGEEVFQIPVALAVPYEHENSLTHSPSFCFRVRDFKRLEGPEHPP